MTQANALSPDQQANRAAIAQTAQRLKALTQRSHQSTWQVAETDLSAEAVLTGQDWQQWAIASRNAKDQIAWPRGKRPIWLCQQIVVPKTLNGYPLAGLSLRLGLTWWADAVAVYLNGELVQEGDLFDYFARIPLSDGVKPGDTFTIAIHLLSPGHDDGALVRSETIYESPDPAAPEPGFVADELTVLQTYAEKLAPEKLSDIATAIAPLDWSKVSQQSPFQAELATLRTRLYPLSDWIKQRQITCVGHAHLDLAWLWPVEDTWRAAERTFRSVLNLQKDFPELTYTHSSPALFDWLETHQPELFQAVLTAVQQGAWTIDAGLWVEPELNTLGGESLARQILYGQRYSRSRFGQASAIAWLPDSFGFSWQLPQLLRLGGIDYFATQKLRWNEATTFPHSLFWWQGLDGTPILSLTLPPIGTAIDPVQMATHSADWEAKTHLPEMLWLPGMGDHGGGPTRDMLKTARRWTTSPFFPRLTFDSPLAHLQRLSQAVTDRHPPLSETVPQGQGAQPCAPTQPLTIQNSKFKIQKPHTQHPTPNTQYPIPSTHHPSTPLPTWNDELYLELHRGCYTVHADQKWYNRRCEDTLREAELFAAIAHMHDRFAYPQATLEQAWQRVMFNQFHDILPGTAIPEVFATANLDWQGAYDTAKTIRAEALGAIAHHLPRPTSPQPDAMPLLLFNSLNWEHTALVEIPLADWPPGTEDWHVFDPLSSEYVTVQISHHTDQNEIPPCQSAPPPSPSARLLFLATVPPVGYRWYWLVPAPPSSAQSTDNGQQEFVLKNDAIEAVIDPATGNLTALREQGAEESVVRSPANQLQAFQDARQYWDAWDIAPNYPDHPLPPAQLVAINWLENGPLRQRVRVVQQIANSTVQQDYVLDQHLPYLKVTTVADWQATQVVLKVTFPLSFESDQATYEIPFGAIARPTQPTDPHDQAKWEVPAYRWADLSDGERGFSLLTDYKHGFDAQPDRLRLTLLKAPLWPDPQADRGRHQFTYALYPHAGDWRAAETPKQAISFNTHVSYVLGTAEPPKTEPSRSTAPTQQSFLPWQTDGTHLAALKLAEDADDRYILRFWELYGQGADLDTGAAVVEQTNLLEAAIAVASPTHLAPWQIATFQTAAFINESLRNSPSAEQQD